MTACETTGNQCAHLRPKARTQPRHLTPFPVGTHWFPPTATTRPPAKAACPQHTTELRPNRRPRPPFWAQLLVERLGVATAPSDALCAVPGA